MTTRLEAIAPPKNRTQLHSLGEKKVGSRVRDAYLGMKIALGTVHGTIPGYTRL